MILDIRFSVLTLALTAGTFIAALYGMNLASGIEEHEWGFWGISAASAGLSVLFFFWGKRKLRSVQTLTMWGHGAKNRASSWGLGIWGRRNMHKERVGDGFSGAGGLGGGNLIEGGRGVRGLRPGESIGDLMKRERGVARRLAQAEAKAGQPTK